MLIIITNHVQKNSFTRDRSKAENVVSLSAKPHKGLLLIKLSSRTMSLKFSFIIGFYISVKFMSILLEFAKHKGEIHFVLKTPLRNKR